MDDEMESVDIYDKYPEKVTIVAAAILGEMGEPHFLPAPARHHDIIRYMVSSVGYKPPILGKQGFITNTGRFVDREVAMQIATEACQVKPRGPGQYQGKELFSEDLW